MKISVIAPIIATMGLAACMTPVGYAPADGPNARGFSEVRIEPERYRVTYRGPANARSGPVYEMALLRAADVTIGQGYDWFRVTNRSDDMRGGQGPRINLGTGGYDYGRSSAVGVGVSGGFYLGGGPTQAVTLEIQLGKGPTPSDRDIYDAREVAQNLRPPPPPPPRL